LHYSKNQLGVNEVVQKPSSHQDKPGGVLLTRLIAGWYFEFDLPQFGVRLPADFAPDKHRTEIAACWGN
jgi:hypothetical protein